MAAKVALVTGNGKRALGWHVAQALAARLDRSSLHSDC
jgi:NAD(P)-dependent dehydrogenase (short-subunit alcohol dehydrogenase family)